MALSIEPSGYKNFLGPIWQLEATKRRLDENRRTDFVKPYLATAAHTGFFSHHFNVIAEGVREFENADFFISNQYGNGPIMATKLVSVLFGINAYDSILLMPFLSFALVLALLLIQLRAIPHTFQATILASSFLGILCTWWFSHFFAPFLYPIRYLPTIVLVILLSTRVLREQSKPQRLSDDALILLFLPLIATYNFEYAIPTVIAVFFAAVIGKRLTMIIASTMTLLLAFIVKFFASPTNQTARMDVLRYFDMEFISIMDIQAKIYIGLMCIVTIFYLLKLRNLESFASNVVIFTALACSYKALGVGSVNHLGAGLLLLGCACCVLHSSTDQGGTYGRVLAKSSLTAFNMGLLLCLLFVLSTWRFTLHTEVPNDRYTETKLSTLQPVSVGLADKAKDYGTLSNERSLVISPSDSVLALWHEQSVTSPYSDLGTTIVLPRLVDNIVEEYKKGTRIIVDRLISDEHYFNELITLLQHPLYASALVDTKYWEMIDAMKDLHVTIVGTGYFEHCGTSKHFEAYCKK